MKIAIPVMKKGLDSEISPSFGRSPYFLIYDIATWEDRYLDNAAEDSQGGAGIKAAQIIADSRPEVLLTPRCGENAAKVLRAAGIELHRAAPGSAMDNLNAFMDGDLPSLPEIHGGYHRRGNA